VATFEACGGHTYALTIGAGGAGGVFNGVVPPGTPSGAGGTTSLVDLDDDGTVRIQAFGGAGGPYGDDAPTDGGLGGGGSASGCVKFAVAQGTQGAPNMNAVNVLVAPGTNGSVGLTLGGSASGGGAGTMMQAVKSALPGGTPGGGGAGGGQSAFLTAGNPTSFNGTAGGPGRITLMYSAPRELRIVD
jgi:hypothetical protein